MGLTGRISRRHERASSFVRARERPERFVDVYSAYYEQVLRFFAVRTLDPETAHDLMAETFAELFDRIEDFRGETEAQGQAWMWTVARHQLYRWRDRGRVEKVHLHRLGIDRTEELGAAEYERVERLADLQVRLPLLDDALESLSAEQRSAVTARVVDERSYADIAASAGVAETVIRARVSRGLRLLALRMSHDALALEEPA